MICMRHPTRRSFSVRVETTTGSVAMVDYKEPFLFQAKKDGPIVYPPERSVLLYSCSQNKPKIEGYVTFLDCAGNFLNHLEPSYYSVETKLVELNCSKNRFEQLDLFFLKELQHLNCSKNRLKKLDLSTLESLVEADLSNNPLISLKLGTHPKLKRLNISNTFLEARNMERLLDRSNGGKAFELIT